MNELKKRDRVMRGVTMKQRTGCRSLYITINSDNDGNIFETFVKMGKQGGCINSHCDAIGRLASVILRAGLGKDIVIKQLKGIRCPSTIEADGVKILSCADAIARALEEVKQ